MIPIRVYMDNELRKLYEQGMTIEQVATEANLSYSTTRRRLIRAGTQLRSRKSKRNVQSS